MNRALMFLVLVLSAAFAAADRPYQLCDAAKSALCNGLVSVYEFEEASDSARTSEVGGLRFLEPDGANVASSTTKKTGSYSLDHTAAANSYVYVPRATGPGGQFTISFWAYVTTLPSASGKRVQVLSTRDSLGNEGYPRLELYHTGTSVVVRYHAKESISDTVRTVTGTQAISASTWYLVTFGQYPNATSTNPYQRTMWLEVNGGTRNTASPTLLYPDVLTVGDFIVGAWRNTSPDEYGAYKIDQLISWEGTFSPADVDKLYNSGSGKAFPFVD